MRGPVGWRFFEGDSGTGPALTLAGGVATTSGSARLRQALMLLLATAPGERVMRPDYGCPLGRLVFSPNDDTTAGLAIHYVRQSVQRWVPEVEILRLDAGRDPAGPAERLWIWLDYRIRAAQQDDRLAIALDLEGGAPGASPRDRREG